MKNLIAAARTRFDERVRGLPSWVVLTELFLALGWLRAAAEKTIDPFWWSGNKLESFLREHQEVTVGWYEPIVEFVWWPYSLIVAVVVVVMQFAIGLALLNGRAVGWALAGGMLLNLNFMAAGAVNPSAFYILSQGAIALWMAERSLRPDISNLLTAAAVLAGAIGVVSLPYAKTLDPAGVIDDPAIMLATAGALTLVSCELASRHTSNARSHQRRGPQKTVKATSASRAHR